MKKAKVKPYPIPLPAALYEAVAQVARERATKLQRTVFMKDVILSALLLDPEIAKHHNRLKREEKR